MEVDAEPSAAPTTTAPLPTTPRPGSGTVSGSKSVIVTKVVDPLVDCGRLLLIDRDPIENYNDEDARIQRARDNTQFLFNKIWELNKKRVEDAIVAVLPKPTYRLPREKHIPQKKTLTKWEEYAKLKGIKKQKKRGKKVYDEASGEWKPRYGMRRGNDNTKDWMAEVPENKPDDFDVFGERKADKKERIAKNEMQRLKNQTRAAKAQAKNSRVIRAPDEIARLGIAKDAEDRSRQEIRVAADRARSATASVGKFQEKIHGEKPNIKTGKKRQFEPNLQDAKKEKDRLLDVARGVLAPSKKARMHDHAMTAAAGTLAPEEGPRDASKKKRGGEMVRQKSEIRRQQHYQSKKKMNKKAIGNAKSAKGKGKRE